MKTKLNLSNLFRQPSVVIRIGAAACASLLLGGHASALSVSWGSEIPSDLRDSYGNRLDDTYYFQLGFFVNTLADPFTPSQTNTEQWASKWVVFDQATYNEEEGFFTSTAVAISETGGSSGVGGNPLVNYTGQEAYIWIFNNQTPSQTTEWLLVRDPSWVFPQGNVPGCCPNELPLEWSVSDLSSGPTPDVPVWGRQGGSVGGGVSSNPLPTSTLQTYTFPASIPEVSSSLLVLLGTSFALLRRRRVPGTSSSLKVPVVTALAALAIASPCRAERIHWFGPTFKDNVTSTGEAIDGDMVFELGLFTDGFVPTAENTSEWAAHWLPAQRAAYSAQGKRFAGKFVVTSADSPFSGGKPAYIWGFRAGVESGEWILFRNETWNFPVLSADQAAEARNPLSALEWNANQATAIVGKIHPDATPYLMESVSISGAVAPKTTWAQWAQAEMGQDPHNSPELDPDGDGVNNLLEYVFGSSPTKSGPPPKTELSLVDVAGDSRHLQVRVPRRADHPANVIVEVSNDLKEWHAGPGHTVVVSDTPAGLVVRDAMPYSSQAKRFIRVRAEVDAGKAP